MHDALFNLRIIRTPFSLHRRNLQVYGSIRNCKFYKGKSTSYKYKYKLQELKNRPLDWDCDKNIIIKYRGIKSSRSAFYMVQIVRRRKNFEVTVIPSGKTGLPTLVHSSRHDRYQKFVGFTNFLGSSGKFSA